jgi:hypothetical protein
MAATKIIFRVRDYDLAATLDSGQVFRWQKQNESWVGVVGKNFARLTQTDGGIVAETSTGIDDLDWLREFLQIGTNLDAVLKTFPDDEPMRAAVAACPGLRLLRQDPWECLASFILSSTKQIVHSFVNALANPVVSSLWLDRIRPQAERYIFPFRPPNDLLVQPKPNCAPARWVFARRTCSPPRGKSPRAGLIWNASGNCRAPRRGRS